jgi:hypothetical protein
VFFENALTRESRLPLIGRICIRQPSYFNLHSLEMPYAHHFYL